MSVRHLLFGSLLLLLGGCRPSATTEDFDAIGAEAPTPTEDVTATGAKIAVIIRDVRDPWNQRLITHAGKEAKNDHSRFSVFKATDSKALADALSQAAAKGIQGIIVCAPDRDEGPILLKAAAKYDLKILNTDDPVIDEKGKVIQPPMLSSDFKSAGVLAAKAMMAATHDKERMLDKDPRERKWVQDESGMILFTHDSLQSAKAVTDEEKKYAVKEGVPTNAIFTVPIDNMSISKAQDLATKVLQQNVQVRDWFIGGMNDTVVIGGLRAIEVAHINPRRAIGVGIEGDGAIYDLQRPIMSGMVASILLPADQIGERAEHEISDWVQNGNKPANYDLFQGVLLNRPNVRPLKQLHHLFQ